MRADMVGCARCFPTANVCAPYGKCSQPVNTLPHHTELKVFIGVLYTLRSLSFCHIFLCSGELFEAIMEDKMYASGSAGAEAKHRENIPLCVSTWGFQQLEEPLMERSRQQMVKISRKLGIGISPFDILKGIVKHPCRTGQHISEKF